MQWRNGESWAPCKVSNTRVIDNEPRNLNHCQVPRTTPELVPLFRCEVSWRRKAPLAKIRARWLKLRMVFMVPITVTANCMQFWFRRFHSGISDVKDAARTSRPVVENVNKITEIIEVDRHVSSRSIAQELKIDHKTISSHLRKVRFKKKLHVWVPRQLTPKNMMDRISILKPSPNGMKSTYFLSGCYTRALGDGPRNFEPWSSDEDDTRAARVFDEAHFWLNGYVNKQNCRIWSEANPQVYVETPLHPEKLTVWCALWAGGILLQKR
ncbi:histone-lysine N-methyltransferase SETMAR [Trichonephila clavipes]|nr:histone-lysine N-methyltransferase SETMAR [Trichonephila clavipes]